MQCLKRRFSRDIFISVTFLLGAPALWAQEGSTPADTEPASASEATTEEGAPPDAQEATSENTEPTAKPEPEPEEEEEPAEVEVVEETASVQTVQKALFRKGELTDYGTTQILARQDFLGVGFGLSEMDGYRYLAVTPDFNLVRGGMALGVGFPLRFEIEDLLSAGEQSSYSIRSQDWDEVSDFLRPLRYFTWGRKEDNFYIDINRVHASTIGHGQLLRNYIPNLDIDEDRLFLSVDAYGDYGGFEFLAGALPIPNEIGVLGFIKPLSFFSTDKQLQSLSLGLSYVGDLDAPAQLETVQQSIVHSTTEEEGVRYAVNDQGNFLWSSNAVHGVGVDGEFKVYKEGPLDIKVYADYSHLFLPAYTPLNLAAVSDGGWTLGTLFRISKGARLGSKPKALFKGMIDEKIQASIMANHAFRIRLEGKTFGPHFLPSYFNSTYPIQRLQMGLSGTAATARLPTKLAYLAQEDDLSQRVGGYLELSYRWLDNLGLTAIYEDAFSTGTQDTVAAGRQVVLHAESHTTSWAQVYLTYHYFSFESISNILKFETDNELLFAGTRFEILPFLFVNAMAQRTFGIQFTDEDLLNRRSLKSGGEELGYTSLGLKNTWTYVAELQLGWKY